MTAGRQRNERGDTRRTGERAAGAMSRSTARSPLPPSAARRTAAHSPATLGETASRAGAQPLGGGGISERETHRQDAQGGYGTDAPTPGLPSIPGERMLTLRETMAHGQLTPQRGRAGQGVLIRGKANASSAATTIVPRRSGPRSAVAQFIGGMVLMLALLSSVALATPLGQTASFGTAFQTYASAIPWIPTPTPTPRPTPTPATFVPPHESNPGTQAIVNEIAAVFGPYAQGALAVARCESGYDPNAWNPYAIGNSHASGVFQILYPSTWDRTSYAGYSPFDANANIHAAYQLFSGDGDTWREWQCQP